MYPVSKLTQNVHKNNRVYLHFKFSDLSNLASRLFKMQINLFTLQSEPACVIWFVTRFSTQMREIALMLRDSDRLCFDVLSQLLWKMGENILLYVRRILLKHLSRCFSISSDAMNLEQRGQWKPEGDDTKTRAWASRPAIAQGLLSTRAWPTSDVIWHLRELESCKQSVPIWLAAYNLQLAKAVIH